MAEKFVMVAAVLGRDRNDLQEDDPENFHEFLDEVFMGDTQQARDQGEDCGLDLVVLGVRGQVLRRSASSHCFKYQRSQLDA